MNSLRRDIHSAFEVITPPLGGMPERVVQTVLADKRRQRKERMVYRMRFPLALVAAVLLVAVAGAAIITWNSLHNIASPVGQAPHVTVQQLEARALHIPATKSAADCHAGPFDNNGGGFGSGPVYANPGPSSSSAWGNYFHVFVYAHEPVSGPILVRAIHLFDTGPVVFVGPNAAGGQLGTDTVDGHTVDQHTEAVIVDPTVSAKDPGLPWNIPTGSVHFFWPLVSGEPKSSVYGTGWQIDGPGFSTTFLAC